MVREARIKSIAAQALGINRKNIYRQSELKKRDLKLREKIETTWLTHPAYGHRRLALHLAVNRKRILRVMHKYGLKPPRRKVSRYCTRSVPRHAFTNLIKDWQPQWPHALWCSDVSYFKFQGRFWYLATILDVCTRRIIGIQVAKHHNQHLILDLLKQALITTKTTPQIFHTDQGSEYLAESVISLLINHRIKVSVSETASPWQNGYQESFFGRLKAEFGDFGRFSSLGELLEAIYAYVYYYNHQRIHTALKMPPAAYEQSLRNMSS